MGALQPPALEAFVELKIGICPQIKKFSRFEAKLHSTQYFSNMVSLTITEAI